MNTYVVTFYRESSDDAENVQVNDVWIESAVEADDLAAGEYDAHELVIAQARRESAHVELDDAWQSSHVTLPDGEVAAVPPGL